MTELLVIKYSMLLVNRYKLALLAVPASLILALPQIVFAWTIDGFGRLIPPSPGQVLSTGRDDSENRSGTSGGRDEFRLETKPAETKTEIRFPDESRIKTEVKEDRTRTEVRQGGVKVRLEQKNGEVRMKVERETENGAPQTLPETKPEIEEVKPEKDDRGDILTIRERLDKNAIRVSTASGQFVIKRNNIGAASQFPLSVDLSTNTLSVTTPAGEKQVAVLPDQAVQNMLAANVVDQIGGQTLANLVSQNPDLSSLSDLVRMIQTDQGTLAYEIQGVKRQKLLGLIPVAVEKIAVVSAETGELLTTNASLKNQILDLFSF